MNKMVKINIRIRGVETKSNQMSFQEDIGFQTPCMGCGQNYKGYSQYCSKRCMNKNCFNGYDETSSDSDTVEMVDRINQKQSPVSPVKLGTSSIILLENTLVNAAHVEDIRKRWRHAKIYVEHYMQGDTIVIDD